MHFINLKNVFKLFIVLVIPLFVFCMFLIFDKLNTGGENIIEINSRLFILKTKIKDKYRKKEERIIPQPVKIKAKDGSSLVIMPEQLYYAELYTKDFLKEPLTKLDKYKKEMLYLNTIDIEAFRTEDLKKPVYVPKMIKLKDGRVLLYETILFTGASYQIYNPKTGHYELLEPPVSHAGFSYYELNSGNLFFITYQAAILFDIKTNKFTKVSDGIPELKKYQQHLSHYDKTVNPLIIPYSDNKIYILLSWYDSIDKVIEYNLTDYSYEIKDFKHNIKAPAASAVIDNRHVMLIDKDGGIYYYDALKDKLKKKGKLKIKASGFLYKTGGNKAVFIPYPGYQNKSAAYPIQVINLKDFSVSVIYKTLQGYADKCSVLDNMLLCPNWTFIDVQADTVYKSLKYLQANEQSAVRLNDDEILITGADTQFASDFSFIMKIKKINSDEFVRRHSLEETYDKNGRRRIDLSEKVIQNMIDEGVLE